MYWWPAEVKVDTVVACIELHGHVALSEIRECTSYSNSDIRAAVLKAALGGDRLRRESVDQLRRAGFRVEDICWPLF